MEKIKVNMSPNPLDVQTIHASQNDGEARQWEFELHNNGELIDTSDVKEQLVFKAYKGGIEQILPENGSTPTTSPFLGDIRYPQGLLADQEFTYRQSPTESDGLAKITDIKGNTIVWNQLIRNGNFADTSNWSAESGATLSISNNIATISSTTASNGIRQYLSKSLTVNHKYLVSAEFNVPTEYRCVVGTGGNQGVQIEKLISTANTWTEVSGIGTCTAETTAFYCFVRGTAYENVKIRNVVCFDLTQMGLDSLTAEEFTSLFPLPYYAYNQGTLLSFNGNGIKTVGKNQSQLVSMTTASGGYINASSGDIANVKKGITYTLSFDNLTASTSNVVARILVDGAWKQQGYKNLVANSRWALTFTATDDGALGLSAGLGSQYSEVKVFDNIQLEFGSTATDYEPYTSSTLSLPISTYFPNGMKSAGNVYDELIPTKATARISRVDLGSLVWTLRDNTYWQTQSDAIPDAKKPSDNVQSINAIHSVYEVKGGYYVQGTNQIGMTTTGVLNCNNGSTTNKPSGYLYYELATPTEISFTTASLVTENAEIPLSNNDGVLIGKCTEQLSENPGFIDAKIKLSDSDGECYSNKIQLHIERSPQ